jgi:hypothetical protein
MTAKKKYQKDYAYALDQLKNFKNYIEITDFRPYLLMVLNLESGPDNILSQLGMGAKGKTILPYDPEKKIYYTKAMSGMSMNNQITLYYRTEPKTDKLKNKSTDPIFTNALSAYEAKNLIPQKYLMICPKILDFATDAFTDDAKPKPFASAIESLFIDLLEFLVVQSPKYVFLLEGKGDAPDLVFTLNLSFDPTHSAPNQYQYFDVFIDTDHRLRGNTFIWTKEDAKENLQISFLKEIKEEFSHSDMFNSNFTIIVPVKSFDIPE